MNTRWGRAGWGRTPATLRRHQAPPSFLHRHELSNEIRNYEVGRVPLRDESADSLEWESESSFLRRQGSTLDIDDEMNA